MAYYRTNDMIPKIGMGTPPLEGDPNYRGLLLDKAGYLIEIPTHLPRDVDAASVKADQPIDSALEQAPTLGHEPADRVRDSQILQAEQNLANKMNMAPPKICIGDASPQNAGMPVIMSNQTQSGKPYILINETALKTFNLKQITTLIALEMSRLRNGQLTPERQAATYNDQSLAFKDTFTADREAAMFTGDPESLKQALQITERARISLLQQAGATDFRNPDHPPLEQRLAQLDKIAQGMQRAPAAHP